MGGILKIKDSNGEWVSIPALVGGTSDTAFASIPSTIHIIVGKEFRMYYKNVLSRSDCKLWFGNASGITVKRYAEYLSITATNECSKSIYWKVYDSSFNAIDSGTMQVIATNETKKITTALVIGDSTVTQGNSISQKLLDCFSESGGTLTLLGTRGTAPALHEGRAGWKAEEYCTIASKGSVANPFYYNGFNFSYYMYQQNYDKVDIVVIQLGINDIFSMTYENFTSESTTNYIEQMVASIIEYDSNIKIVIDLLSVPNGNGTSFTDAYGTTQIDFVNLANSIRMSKALIEKFKDNVYVTISPNNCVLDSANDIYDGVHPNSTGYVKLGQAIYETINGIFVVPLWDLASRTGQQLPESSDATVARTVNKYYYLESYTGTVTSSVIYNISDFLATKNSLEFTVNRNEGYSTILSSYGITVPLGLEVGKTYTFSCQTPNTKSGVRLLTYSVKTVSDGDGVRTAWVYESNTPICYNSTDLNSITITPQAGKGYAICFSQNEVGIKHIFNNISLVENK